MTDAELDALLTELQAHLNAENETIDFELWYEIDCPLCAEDGFEECQGHPYSDESGFLD
jgi:hypothetical protein